MHANMWTWGKWLRPVSSVALFSTHSSGPVVLSQELSQDSL